MMQMLASVAEFEGEIVCGRTRTGWAMPVNKVGGLAGGAL